MCPTQHERTPRTSDTIRAFNGIDRLLDEPWATVVLGGGPLTFVATDGLPGNAGHPRALLIGIGEHYDVEVTVPGRGAFPLLVVAEGKGKPALAVLRARPATSGASPHPGATVSRSRWGSGRRCG